MESKYSQTRINAYIYGLSAFTVLVIVLDMAVNKWILNRPLFYMHTIPAVLVICNLLAGFTVGFFYTSKQSEKSIFQWFLIGFINYFIVIRYMITILIAVFGFIVEFLSQKV